MYISVPKAVQLKPKHFNGNPLVLSVRRTFDYYAHRAFTSKQSQTESICQRGARIDTVCGDLQRDTSKHMEDLAWTNEKGEGGGDIIALSVRACFIQGLYDDLLRQWLRQGEM
jgi:hypothetical protein